MHRFPPSARLAGLLTVVAALGAACVSPGQPGLTLTEFEANLVFGFEPEPEVAPTPVQAAAELPPPDLPLPDLFTVGDKIPPRRPAPLPPPPNECPETEEIAVQYEAKANVPYNREKRVGVRPVEGVYRFQVLYGRGTAKAEVSRIGFEKRAIRNVTDLPTSQWPVNPVAGQTRQVFTYEEVRNVSYVEEVNEGGNVHDRLVERFLVTTYQVDTDGLTASSSATSGVVQPPKAGDPERGVALVKTVLVDGAGDPVPGVEAFEPTNGLLLLPLAVSSSEEFRAAATDARTGRVVVNDATRVSDDAGALLPGGVGSAERIDACGKFMEGWEVVSRQTITGEGTGGTAAPGNFDYTVRIAPQHGGVVIYEDVFNRQTFNRYVYSQAQFEPDPLPEDGLPR